MRGVREKPWHTGKFFPRAKKQHCRTMCFLITFHFSARILKRRAKTNYALQSGILGSIVRRHSRLRFSTILRLPSPVHSIHCPHHRTPAPSFQHKTCPNSVSASPSPLQQDNTTRKISSLAEHNSKSLPAGHKDMHTGGHGKALMTQAL